MQMIKTGSFIVCGEEWEIGEDETVYLQFENI